MNLSIVSAKYVAPLKVELHFNDGIIKTVDVGAFIRKHPHPQYNSYLNENKFKKFKIEFGNIVWGKNWDLIFPIDKLYAGIPSHRVEYFIKDYRKILENVRNKQLQ